MMNMKPKNPSGKRQFTDVGQTCYKCQQFKLFSEFNKNKTRPSSYNAHCRQCAKTLRVSYYKRNKNKEATNAALWQTSNKEYVLEKDRIRYRSNLEYFSIKNKRWMSKNPDARRAITRNRRARKKLVNECWTAADERFVFNLFSGKCFCCGSIFNLQIDHFRPLIKGHPLTRQNAVLLCKSCNSSKGYKNPEQFFSKSQLDKLENIRKGAQ